VPEPEARVEERMDTQKKSASKDPVCGMDVDTSVPGVPKSHYRGRSYFFCNASCKESFDRAPEKYLNTQRTATT
jgi:YHS domain-containing protein